MGFANVPTKLYDVNLLINAHRAEASNHRATRAWFENEMAGPEPFIRIVTSPKVYKVPTPLADAIETAESIRSNPLCTPIHPGRRHFEIFAALCRSIHATGPLVADAYLAALAIERGCRWYTFDRDFLKFPGLDATVLNAARLTDD